MAKSSLFRVFPNEPIPPFVDYADGCYIYTKDGRKILDTSAGGTSYAVLGWNNPNVNEAIRKQLDRFGHMDYKIWSDTNTEELAELLTSMTEHGLDKVYFAGNSGAEACEAAMKMSYQVHYDLGRREKKWFISREQSYHGSTADALALGERPNLEFFRSMLSPFRARIPMHHPLYLKKENETLDEYAKRSAKELEDKIIEIGPEKVCAFVGETIMGGLVGDVTPAPNYWRYIREVCDRYDVHLIMDEVYCGTGTSGKIYCCDWDNVVPDFIFIGKTLAAGYGALSAVITSSKMEDVIKKYQGRLQHTTTHQAHSLSVAAALAVQKIIHNQEFLAHVNATGEYMRAAIRDELGRLPIFRDVRGRGMRFSFEYKCENQNEFGANLSKNMLENHNILLNAKWHRVCFTPPLIMTKEQAGQVLEAMFVEVKNLI
ncbi:MAG: aminotransferase class III-fold pyridoxal phosphate-dependent enzyme [Campylobacterales bacterium]|nr:aminotransferase class III-fold pyridoxal phosphate-dependent enzyme [Campylobacterales bacterium]